MFKVHFMVKEKNILGIVLFSFFFFLVFFVSLRIYILYSENIEGNFPFSEAFAGFCEDAFLASLLTCFTYIALALSKVVYFILIFPLNLIVIITSYSNLQYVNFFRENLRLFDFEYLRNIGGTWKSTISDLWLHPGEFLFLILPILILVGQLVFIIRLRKKKVLLKNALIFQFILLFFAANFFYIGYRLQNKGDRRAFHQSNYFVWMIRDIPWLHRYFRTTKELKKVEVTFQDKRSLLGTLEVKPLEPKDLNSKTLYIKERPFPLPEGYIWYDESYPFVKIPRRDAVLMGLLPKKEGSEQEARKEKPVTRRNVVFLILEGFRTREIDIFGGPYSITPNFNKLASKSILYKNFYGHADLTAGAQLASIASFYDIFKGVNLMRDHSQVELFSLPEVLRLFGYSSYWINTWSADFDNTRLFFHRHGDVHIVDKYSFPVNSEMAGWAYSDEELMRKAVDIMDKTIKPFFTIIITSTNHLPYEVPREKFKLGLETGLYGKFLNTFYYTDYALGYLFKLLRTRKYFRDTLFFIFADTGINRRKEDEEPSTPSYFSNVYHIPLFIYDPLVEEGKVVEEIAAQVDIAPTVLDLLGIEIANHFVGQSLLRERNLPYYLAYHGRGDPKAFYIDEHIVVDCYVEKGKFHQVFRREDGKKINVPLKERENILSRIQTLTTLTDWTILNDRIWDKRLTEFYRSLYKKSGNSEN
ncbi:MAG: LTA synthase family protein [Candidatus Aminicenantaceae bacterium]